MVNTLFLPELREMLSQANEAELHEFCTALHPARTAEFMEGLQDDEIWRVLQYANPALRAEIFGYFEWDRKVELLQNQDNPQVVELLKEIPNDDIVDLVDELPEDRVEGILSLMPPAERRDIRRLRTFEEGTAGAIMTTEAVRLTEDLTVRQALEQLAQDSEFFETVYYLYVVDDTDHLRGIVSARALISSISRQDRKLSELMDTDLVCVRADEDQSVVAEKVAKYNLLAIPVVDDQRHMLGIITHDDIIDVIHEEAADDLQRSAAVEPLSDSYMRTDVLTLAWKRGMWLVLLFFFALLTAFVLERYDEHLTLDKFAWLVAFIPLIISSGGNSGSQSSTLIISALATKDVDFEDWYKVLKREIVSGLMLGGVLATIGYFVAVIIAPSMHDALVIPITILCVVVAGTSIGGILPLILKRLGLDPALMSNPFVAGLIDILGILIYLNVAFIVLR
jgi:magnesium transporter